MIKTRLVSTFHGTLAALAAAVALALIRILLVSDDPSGTVRALFLGPFLDGFSLGNMFDTSSFLVITGIAVSLAFRAGVFNLGGEGQVYAGALVGAMVCIAVPDWGGAAGIAASCFAAAAAGAVISGLSGYLRMKLDIDELITSFLISAALIPIIDYAVAGPLRDPAGYLLATREIGTSFRLVRLFPPSRLSSVAVLAVIAAFVYWFYLFRTFWGYEHRMCGLNRDFARYGGIDVDRFLLLPMVMSGALHGLAGGLHVLGARYACIQGGTAGMGWNGIAVALIARTHPAGIIPAALVFAYLDAGSKTAMIRTNFTFELSAMVQAVVFLLITAQAFTYTSLLRRLRRMFERRNEK